MPQRSTGLPPLIAVVGCDGSGKSTVSQALVTLANEYGPTALVHLGKQQGNTGRWFARLPLVGGWFDRLIERKAADVRSSRATDKAPDLLPALVMYAFVLRRVRRFRRMTKLRRQGLIIIADRYPQAEIPGGFDGPDISATDNSSGFVKNLAARERRAFQWMTSHLPDLVIRLNVDLDTAFARKPDHRRESLARKIAIASQLTYNGAPLVEIDATQPLAAVLAEAKTALSRTLHEQGYQRSAS